MTARFLAVLVLLLAPAPFAQRSARILRDDGRWGEGFGAHGVYRGAILDWEVFDDGTGPAVYACGAFRAAGGEIANGVARWDGEHWHALGHGIRYSFAQEVRTLEVFDDGSGPALYAGGRFDRMDGQPADGFAVWDGDDWIVLPGVTGFGINVLLAGQDENGPALFAGGEFVAVGGVSARNVARWTANGWAPVGGGLPIGQVYSLAFFGSGNEQALYAGTNPALFPAVQGTLWRFGGTSWSEVPNAPIGPIEALLVHDDGGGERLFCGGNFRGAGGIPAEGVLAFDGTTFSALDSINSGATVLSLATFPDPSSGEELLVIGGRVSNASGQLVRNVATWDGTSFSPLGNPVGAGPELNALGVFDTGSGPLLHVGGTLFDAGPVLVDNAAAWDGAQWSPLGSELGFAGPVQAFAEYEGELILGGEFSRAGGTPLGSLASWDGHTLGDVGGGISAGGAARVNALLAYESGDGPVLLAGGMFQRAGGLVAPNIARWNGSSWSPLADGLTSEVLALTTFDAGPQPVVVAGGRFFGSGLEPLGNVGRWNGVEWFGLEGGVSSTSGVAQVQALAQHDDGTGPALYVGGRFDTAGTTPVLNIARWDGTGWTALPSGGISHSTSVPEVKTLLSVDLPSLGGRVLVVGGVFDDAGGVPVNDLAVLGPGGWAPLGTNYPGGSTRSLTVFDAGNGPALVAGGTLLNAKGLVTWDGSRWAPLGGGIRSAAGLLGFPAVRALVSYDDGSGPELWAGGNLEEAGRRFTRNLARWSRTGPGPAAPTRR